MAVPKQRKTTSKVKQRRGMHIFIKPKATALCKNCNKSILPHIVCNFCGFYKGKEVINVFKRAKKRDKKKKEAANVAKR